ncbi:BA75_04226T0 [Komagataella pastoris]|uniref:BA75_04226T0 n=1 Tax=Komagataella pastoris TaxID=4922 RepID=A0A1B2JH41_PICPA|nr:BA75_04226T0 [Komagataella pastoris]
MTENHHEHKDPNEAKKEGVFSSLREKLEEDAAYFVKAVQNGEIDWFLRGSNVNPNVSLPSATPLKSPTIAKSPNSKSDATVETSPDTVSSPNTSKISEAPLTSLPKSSQFKKGYDTDDEIPTNRLTRSRTVDGTMTASRRRSSISNADLTRTSTNQNRSTFNEGGSSPPGGIFKKLFRRKSKEASPSAKKLEEIHRKIPPKSQSPSASKSSHDSSTVPKPRNVKVKIDKSLTTFKEEKDRDDAETDAFSDSSAPDSDTDDYSLYLENLSIKVSNKNIDPKLREYLKFFEAQREEEASARASLANSASSSIQEAKKVKLDFAGHPIPPHPDRPKLPSAFSVNPKFKDKPDDQDHGSPISKVPSPSSQGSGVLGSLLRRTKTNDRRESSPQSPSHFDYPQLVYTKPPPRIVKKPGIPVLNEIAPLKKVAFAATMFVNDPPQQIPSRNPRKGNVVVSKTGEIIINKINPEDLLKHGGGIVVGGSAKSKHDPETENKGAHKDVEVDGSKVTIDKPMVRRRPHVIEMDKPLVTLKLDELYTRCCHLREILPIPSTLKQIPKGSTDPLPILQLRNPKPSLIEVLSFSDFIRIAPVVSVSLDGASLTLEMFRTILASLVNKKHLRKLSLRNMCIDNEGWKLLCWFLTMNSRVERLDITQCPMLQVGSQKRRTSTSSALKKPEVSPTTQKVMESNTQNRSDMDWPLFIASLIFRGGMRELVLTGCKINDFVVFENLISMALSHKTWKIGLAYNELSTQQCEVLAQMMVDYPELMGLDLGYNDLSTSIKVFTDASKKSEHQSQLRLLSLNCCNLQDNQEVKELIISLSKLPTLKFLDLSNNKKMFPKMTTFIASYLPLFPELSRLCLDNNDLSTAAIITFSEAVRLCRKLCSFSLVGNTLDEAATIALTNAVKNSESLFTLNCSFEGMSPKYKEQIGLYTMRNMEKILYTTDKTGITEDDNRETWTEKMSKYISKDGSSASAEELKALFDEAKEAKNILHETMQALFKLQVNNRLNLEGKETLIRLCILDSSLDKGIKLLSSKAKYSVSDVSNLFVSKLTENTEADEPLVPFEDNGGATLIKDNSTPDNDFSSKMKQQLQEESSVAKNRALVQCHLKTPKVLEKLKDIDGDSIRKLLLTGDAQKLSEVLNTFKEKGIPVESIFGKSPCKGGDKSLVETIKTKLHGDQHSPSESEDNYSEESKKNLELNKVIGKMSPGEAAGAASEEDLEIETISKAYDDILSKIADEQTIDAD